MNAIRFDAVLSSTAQYQTGAVIERRNKLKHSEFESLKATTPEGKHWICVGWTNPNPGTWVID